MSTSDKIAKILLWPGEKVCDITGIKGEDHRLILRVYANLVIYGIIGLSIMMVIIDRPIIP